MPIQKLTPAELRLTIAPDTMGFAYTSELLEYPLPWIGQARAEQAARFGLGMNQPDYNLFVLGEVGSGRSSLLKQAMQTTAASKAVPPDLCYLHNFDAPERPRALRLPAGQGRLLRQFMAQLTKSLQTEIPRLLDGQDFKAESERIAKTYKTEETRAYAELEAFAEARSFTMHRETGHILFTLIGKKGRAYTEDEVLALPEGRRAEIALAELGTARRDRPLFRQNPADGTGDERGARSLAAPGGEAAAGSRTSGYPCRAEKADQGCGQARRISR